MRIIHFAILAATIFLSVNADMCECVDENGADDGATLVCCENLGTFDRPWGGRGECGTDVGDDFAACCEGTNHAIGGVCAPS